MAGLAPAFSRWVSGESVREAAEVSGPHPGPVSGTPGALRGCWGEAEGEAGAVGSGCGLWELGGVDHCTWCSEASGLCLAFRRLPSLGLSQ